MIERVIMAGFGGQGMMLIGKLLASAAMKDGREVTFFPSYGAEVRGGTAHSHVVISTEPIYSPIVEEADTLIIMNQPSYEKFRPRLKPDGLLILNSSMLAAKDEGDAEVIAVPVTELADELGSVRVGNVIMLGLYNEIKKIFPSDAVFSEVEKVMTGRKAKLLDLNRRAWAKGRELAAGARG